MNHMHQDLLSEKTSKIFLSPVESCRIASVALANYQGCGYLPRPPGGRNGATRSVYQFYSPPSVR